MAGEKKSKILIVDDSSTNNLLFQNILEAEGYNVVVATDGKSALNIVPNEMPDLILLDIMMPEIDGFEVLENLKGNQELKNIPVIILTARRDSLSMKRGLDLGAEDFLIKPIGMTEILDKIEVALDGN